MMVVVPDAQNNADYYLPCQSQINHLSLHNLQVSFSTRFGIRAFWQCTTAAICQKKRGNLRVVMKLELREQGKI